MPTSDRILDFLRQQAPFCPTIREIADAVGLSAHSAVVYHLERMEKDGLIERERNKVRAIRVLSVERLRIVIDLPWVPDAIVRGNTRGHYQQVAAERAKLRDRGHEHGLVAKQDHPQYEYPLKGPLELRVTIWNPRLIDWVNAAIAIKPIEDGLQEFVKRDQYGGVPGAGLIVDDSQIRTAVIKTRIGQPRTQIVLIGLEPEDI